MMDWKDRIGIMIALVIIAYRHAKLLMRVEAIEEQLEKESEEQSNS